MIDRINYATLMYYHSVINSENRLVEEIVIQQQQKQLPNTFYERVPQLGKSVALETTSKSIKGINKLQWKRYVKKRFRKKNKKKTNYKDNATERG